MFVWYKKYVLLKFKTTYNFKITFFFRKNASILNLILKIVDTVVKFVVRSLQKKLLDVVHSKFMALSLPLNEFWEYGPFLTEKSRAKNGNSKELINEEILIHKLSIFENLHSYYEKTK